MTKRDFCKGHSRPLRRHVASICAEGGLVRGRATAAAASALALLAVSIAAVASAWALPEATSPLTTATAEPGGQATVERGGQAGERRIVSIADIHGAFESFTDILQEVGLIDENLDWVGGDSIMVQTGDFTDRGPEVRRTMDLLMRLQRQAAEDGGEVIVTLGNHEAMNLVGFLRDNSPADAAGFADDESPRRRDDAWQEWMKVRRGVAESMDKPRPRFTDDVRRGWEETRPYGHVERIRALSADGEYGRWLRSLPTAVKIGNVLFMHAGLNPEYADLDIDEINERVSSEVQRYDEAKRTMEELGLITTAADLADVISAADEKLGHMLETMERTGRRPDAEGQQLARTLDWLIQYQSWQLLTRDGLLWFRGLAQWPEDEHAEDVAGILQSQGVDHIVVGHSVQLEGDARTRFDGAVFLTDTGMLSEVYGGRPSALEIRNGTFTAVYVGERRQLYPVPAVAATERSTPPPGAGPSAASAPASAGSSTDASTAWLGSNGEPLPFIGDDEVLEYLRTAEIVSVEDLGSGKTNPQLVELERDGVRARAIFHEVDIRRSRVRIDEQFYPVFYDSWRSQVAAYEVARLIGLRVVAPTVDRTIGDRSGSLQLWLENDGLRTNAERIRSLDHPPDVDAWLHQEWAMQVFDALIANPDRHHANALVDGQWNLWLIDHTRAFQVVPDDSGGTATGANRTRPVAAAASPRSGVAHGHARTLSRSAADQRDSRPPRRLVGAFPRHDRRSR